jgi:hypothetical protein
VPKYLQKNQHKYKKGRFILAHGLSPWSLGSITLGHLQGRTAWWGAHGGAKLLTSWQTRSKKKEERGTMLPISPSRAFPQ